jgi:hypothetical protein
VLYLLTPVKPLLPKLDVAPLDEKVRAVLWNSAVKKYQKIALKVYE